MRFKIEKFTDGTTVNVEESFTLIDFMLLFACFLLGIFFALFLWMFAFAVLVKVFTRREIHFDTDKYEIIYFIRVFNYFRFKLRTISFGEVRQILLSDQSSGKMLAERGMTNKEWFTLEIETDTKPIRLCRVEEDEYEDAYELFEEIEESMDLYFQFRIFLNQDFVEGDSSI